MVIVFYAISIVITACFLGFIPASIAKKKGYSFGLWWFYGWMLFIVAIIHVNLIPDKNEQVQQTHLIQFKSLPKSPPSNIAQSAADELIKYKELIRCWSYI